MTSSTSSSPTPSSVCAAVRSSSVLYRSLPPSVRSSILLRYASLIESHQSDILSANAQDVSSPTASSLSPSNQKRLILTPSKLQSVVRGIRHLSSDDVDPLNCIVSQREVTANLILSKVTIPLGVLLIIFESRPDVLPQLIALALRTGNGLIMKGGKEAQHSLKILYDLSIEAIKEGAPSSGLNGESLLVLLTDRSSTLSYLSCGKGEIDVIIPRGSNDLVKYIEGNTKIPVMGHSDGICHIYVDDTYGDSLTLVFNILIDAKCDYPSACNSVETILIHRRLLTEVKVEKDNPKGINTFERILNELVRHQVNVNVGPRVPSSYAGRFPVAETYRREYGDLTCTVEIVDDVNDAVRHINEYGSHHTDGIISSSKESIEKFQLLVDSACVFVNASTRFADGYRFGLGCEVGISTSRLHARGPVGVDGICTYKWVLRSTDAVNGHTVTQHNEGKWEYTHKDVKVSNANGLEEEIRKLNEAKKKEEEERKGAPSPSTSGLNPLYYKKDCSLTDLSKSHLPSLLSLFDTSSSLILDFDSFRLLSDWNRQRRLLAGSTWEYDEDSLWWQFQSLAFTGESSDEAVKEQIDGKKGITLEGLEEIYTKEWNIEDDIAKKGGRERK